MERNNNGFTLVELVVVISILGVLIAILAPGYTSKIHKAKVATDWANVKSYYNEIQTDYMFTDKVCGTGKVKSTITYPSFQFFRINRECTGIPLLHRHPTDCLFHPLV